MSMTVQTHVLQLQDELQPQCGSGMRYIKAQVGRKWVYVRETEWTNRKRIKKALWLDLVKQTEKYNRRNGRAIPTLVEGN